MCLKGENLLHLPYLYWILVSDAMCNCAKGNCISKVLMLVKLVNRWAWPQTWFTCRMVTQVYTRKQKMDPLPSSQRKIVTCKLLSCHLNESYVGDCHFLLWTPKDKILLWAMFDPTKAHSTDIVKYLLQNRHNRFSPTCYRLFLLHFSCPWHTSAFWKRKRFLHYTVKKMQIC